MAETDDVLRQLAYIAESPSHDAGGFHPEAVETARAAIKLISDLKAENESLASQLAEADEEVQRLEKELEER